MKKTFQSNPATHPHYPYQNGKFAWMLLIVVLTAALFIACAPITSTPDTTEEPPTDAPPTDATEEPSACVREGGTFTCNGLDGHQIIINNVPDDVTAELLEVSDARREELLKAPLLGTACIFMIAGDLVFYQNGEFATQFDPPLEITYFFMEQDLAAFATCQKTVVSNGLAVSADDVQFLPVYYDKNEWKPFETIVSIDEGSGAMTIQTTFWGDQPVGGGTKP